MKTKLSLFITIVLMLCTLVSCDPKRVFDSYVTVPDNGWSKDSLAFFEVDAPPIDKPVNLYLKVRNTNEYANSSLWLFVDIKAPNGIVQRDTVECVLADVSGKWYGKGWGSIYHLNVPYKGGIKFAEYGKYQFKISHGMRTSNLKGIKDIGLRIEKAY